MVVPALPASPLAALVARVDAEAAEAAADGTSDRDASARHKALVRAAGRAALEETLNPTRQVADLSMESLTCLTLTCRMHMHMHLDWLERTPVALGHEDPQRLLLPLADLQGASHRNLLLDVIARHVVMDS